VQSRYMSGPMSDISFDGETGATLERFGFDRETFESLRGRLRARGRGNEQNIIAGQVTAPADGDVAGLPARGTPERAALEERGWKAISAGEVGVVMLAGGMATRFGGVVKAAAEVVDGRSFLDVKLADTQVAAARAKATVPAYLMASFATGDAVRKLGEARRTPQVPVETFTQFVSVRLTPEAELFLEKDGRPSLYAPGHGDLTFALRASKVLQRFRAAGGKVLLVSNVDNVAATLDPAVIGAHLASGKALTAEVAPKAPGDKGGAPARVDGVLQIVESFRFPAAFDQDAIPVFNTNTFVLDAEAIDRAFDLTWFAVSKKIDGREGIQFERLMGQLTAFLPSNFLRVDRDGLDGRFQPAKDPEELASRRDEIRRILQSRGVL
jgi:UTP--glucose-1-phosphate uridylyltransferase